MPLSIRPYDPDTDPPAIDRLNARLAEGGVDLRFGADPVTAPADSLAFGHRFFVAADGPEIRGGVCLTEQGFQVDGAVRRMGWVRFPIAESLVNPRYAGVPGALMFQLLRAQPQLMALGLGGHEGQFAQMLARLGWAGSIVPFYFAFLRPSTVLRHLEYARTTRWRRVAMDVLSATGIGWAGYRAASAWRTRGRAATRIPASYRVEEVATFGSWVDDLWERFRSGYGFTAARTRATLEATFNARTDGLVRLRVRRGETDVGWVTVVVRDRRSGAPDRYFGRATVGLISDSFGDPDAAPVIVSAALGWLRDAKVDLVVSNQAHPALGQALTRAGCFRGPSRFAFYRSPATEKVLPAYSPDSGPAWHVNRGDCDGPGGV